MTYIKKESDGSLVSMNFVAPTGGAAAATKEPLFPLPQILNPAYAATQAVAVKQMNTFVQPATYTGNATLNLTINDQVTPGALLHLKLTANTSARTVTLGTGFADPDDITVIASSTAYMSFVFDGTEFVPLVYIPEAG